MKLSNIAKPAYHRNGVAGMPFQVTTFTMQEDGETRQMVAIRFEDDDSNGWTNPSIAVFDLDLLAKGDVSFGSNSWRGDHFADELDQYFYPEKEAF